MTVEQPLSASLAVILAELAGSGSVPWSSWPAGEAPERFGLVRQGDRVVPLAPFDPLRAEALQAALSPAAARWLRQLEVFPAIGSTNTHLMNQAASRSLDGQVCLAEVQVQGRGRRGRNWMSPFGAQLAVSLGLAVERPPAELGGVSLVVGLAVADALDQLGVADVTLKWPNDVLLGAAKLGGILIEMVHGRGTELVVGVGINVALPEAVRNQLPHAVASLADRPGSPGRNPLAACIISRVVEFVRAFDDQGFGPFRPVFEARHHYHGQDCVLLQGDLVIAGTVTGISDSGGLLVHTEGGIREFHGGEVSLRTTR